MDESHATAKGNLGGSTLNGPPPSSAVTIINIDGNKYLLQLDAPVLSVGTLNVRDGRQYVPATSFGGLVKEAKDPEEVMRTFGEDDVWTKEFLSLVVFTPDDAGRIEAFLAKIPSKTLASGKRLNVAHGQSTPLAPGPYVFDCLTGNLYRPDRLFKDTSNAFVRGALPVGGMATGMGYSSDMYQCLEVSDMLPIPSKLYHLDEERAATKKPLAGLRFGVKDSIDVAGLHTSNGSKDFRETYPTRIETAPCVARLIEAGAVMVGKLRCGQWCDGQDPVDRIEEPTPINPRGDGFQKPSGSSSGSAAGCASYPWLDFTVGTDTGGSVRHPAAVNGVYGVRPSSGRIQSRKMLVCNPLLDTPGVLARSAAMAERVTKVMFVGTSPAQAQHHHLRRRFKLLYAIEPNTTSTTPKFFSAGGTGPEAPTAAGQIMESFVSRLEAYLGTRREELNLYDRWTSTTDFDEDLVTATAKVYEDLVYGHMARNAVARFTAEYRAARGPNAQPFIEATTRKRLEYGKGVSDFEMKSAEYWLEALADWINSVVLPGPRSTGATTFNTKNATGTTVTAGGLLGGKMGEEEEEDVIPLLVYPQVWAQPAYRDEPATRARLGPGGEPLLFWTGFSAYSLAYASGCPDIAVPLGEVPFTSRITGEDSSRSTKLPVAISIMAPRGMDEVLLGLLTKLEESGILREVKCGSQMFRD